MHYNVLQRVERIREWVEGSEGRVKGSGDVNGEAKAQVVVKRDAVLVMGRDEEEGCRLSAGATFALQGRPWRMEVDAWKSFVNVELKFLEGLDEVWVE